MRAVVSRTTQVRARPPGTSPSRSRSPEGGNGQSGIRASKPASPPPPAAPPGGLGLIFQLLVLLCTRSHVSHHPHSSIHSVLSFGPKRDGGPLPERSRSRPVTEVGSLFASGVLIGVLQHRFATTRSPRRPLRRGALLHRQQQVHFPRSPIPTERTSAPSLPFSSLSLPFPSFTPTSRVEAERAAPAVAPSLPPSRALSLPSATGALTPLHSRWDSAQAAATAAVFRILSNRGSAGIAFETELGVFNE